MTNSRTNIIGIFAGLAAVPVWLFLMTRIPQSTGFGGSPDRYVIAPIVLCGITAAIHRLLRHYPIAWPLSALIAGVSVLGTLIFLASISG